MTIAEEWDLFVMMILPPDAPPIQKQEMRRAFYAGVEACLKMTWTMGERSENEGVALIESWHQEVLAFGKKIERGEA